MPAGFGERNNTVYAAVQFDKNIKTNLQGYFIRIFERHATGI